MLNKDVLRNVGIVVKGILKVTGTIVLAGVALVNAYDERYSTGYNRAVEAIMKSSMFSSDKAKAVNAMELNSKPEIYESIIQVTKSSLYSSDKLNLIIEMCKKGED